MTNPDHPTEKFCQGRIHFHESGVLHYRQHGDNFMAAWSENEAEKWRTILRQLQGEPTPVPQTAPSGPRVITQADINMARRKRAVDAKGGEDGRYE